MKPPGPSPEGPGGLLLEPRLFLERDPHHREQRGEIARELHCKTKSVDNALMRIKRKVTAASVEGVEWPFAE